MFPSQKNKILIDGREFERQKMTGIGRVIKGLTMAIIQSELTKKICLCVHQKAAVDLELQSLKDLELIPVPFSFLRAEKIISSLCKEYADLFISPYPKLPFFGFNCKTIHTVHDILDLTHAAYRKRLKVLFDTYRLKKALKKSNLTWYDSAWSLKETQKYMGFAGHDPRIRYPGIEARFNSQELSNYHSILKKYHLDPGYLLCIGNGKSHKNLGILLTISGQLQRKLVFIGVPNQNQLYWKAKYPDAFAEWIEHIDDVDLPAVIKQAFCLVQPSTAEGYGYPPLEAMACGVPVVISKIPVLMETTGGHALYASPHVPKEWLDLLKTLEDHSILKSQVEKGLKWSLPLQGNKGWEKHLQDIEELLKRA